MPTPILTTNAPSTNWRQPTFRPTGAPLSQTDILNSLLRAEQAKTGSPPDADGFNRLGRLAKQEFLKDAHLRLIPDAAFEARNRLGQLDNPAIVMSLDQCAVVGKANSETAFSDSSHSRRETTSFFLPFGIEERRVIIPLVLHEAPKLVGKVTDAATGRIYYYLNDENPMISGLMLAAGVVWENFSHGGHNESNDYRSFLLGVPVDEQGVAKLDQSIRIYLPANSYYAERSEDGGQPHRKLFELGACSQEGVGFKPKEHL